MEGKLKMRMKQGNKIKVFGATYINLNNPFFVEVNDSLKAVIEREDGQLISLDAATNTEDQIEQIERLIDYGVDAIFLAPVDWKGIKPALEIAQTAGIPVFNIDTPVYDVDLVESIISSDNYDAGVQNANDMMERLNSAKIAIIEIQNVKSTMDRVQGFMDTIAGKEEYEVVVRQSTSGLSEDAILIMEDILKTHSEINLVMTVNDLIGIGVLEALEAAGRVGDVLIYSVDGSPDVKILVKKGAMTATVAQSPHTIGTRAAEMAYIVLAGGTVEKNIIVPVFIITKDNVDKYGVVGWQ